MHVNGEIIVVLSSLLVLLVWLKFVGIDLECIWGRIEMVYGLFCCEVLKDLFFVFVCEGWFMEVEVKVDVIVKWVLERWSPSVFNICFFECWK